jgi:1-phosphofructokinase family hexose kinase
MIYTITLNPALDVSGKVDELVLNEKCYVFEASNHAGGNGINSGVIAHRLGAEVILTGFLGGKNGDEIKNLLRKNKIPQKFISIAGETRMNVSISSLSNHQQTRLSFPGPEISRREGISLERFLRKVRARDVVLLGGSLPQGLRKHYLKDLIKALVTKDVRVLLDLPGKDLKKVLKLGAHFIKPNLAEFQLLIGKKVSTIDEVILEAQDLLKHVPVICVSSVEGGALLITRERIIFGKLPRLKIRSTVGAGDSMVGAIASLWEKNSEAHPKELLRIGLAASGATLSERGLSLGTKKSIHSLMKRINLREL